MGLAKKLCIDIYGQLTELNTSLVAAVSIYDKLNLLNTLIYDQNDLYSQANQCLQLANFYLYAKFNFMTFLHHPQLSFLMNQINLILSLGSLLKILNRWKQVINYLSLGPFINLYISHDFEYRLPPSYLILPQKQMRADMQIKPNKIYNQYLKTSMNSQYLKYGVAIALLLSLLVILPHLFTSLTQQHYVKVTPRHSLDSTFLPQPQSIDLQAKANQLAARIKNLKNGSACTGSEGVVCQNLKSHYQGLIEQANIAHQKKVNECMIYESMWNTTCQKWKNESERLSQTAIELDQELKSSLNKMQAMGDQIIQLQTQIRNIPPCSACQPCQQKPCLACPQGVEKECPIIEPCQQCQDECPLCQVCQECLHCHDQDYNQLKHEFTTLTRRLEDCKELAEEARNKPNEPDKCSLIQNQLNQNLRDGLNGLSITLQKASLGSAYLTQVIVKALQQLYSSKSVQDSLSVVPLVLDGLRKELHDLDAKSKQEASGEKQCEQCGDSKAQILDECMGAFKKAVDKLKVCQKQLSPFLASNKQ